MFGKKSPTLWFHFLRGSFEILWKKKNLFILWTTLKYHGI